MGHTVRNSAHYDRLWMPGISKESHTSGSKIEYLEDRRRAKITPLRTDTLQYDFNFTRTAAAHSDKPPKIRYLEPDSARRSAPGRPQGVGGRRQTPPAKRSGQNLQQHAQSSPQHTADPRRAPAKPKSAAPKNAVKPHPQPKSGKRPQRDMVTDFRSVGPQGHQGQGKAGTPASGSQPKPRSTGNKNGHGRKLTPTYDLHKKGLLGSKYGAPVMEGGVIGFDMGTYEKERAVEEPISRPLKPKSLISTIVTIALVFILLCIPLALQAQVSNYTQQNTGIEDEIETLEEEISKLKMEIALQEDLGNIQQRAAALGMSHPKDNQVEYVDLSSTDQVVTSTRTQHDEISDVSEEAPDFFETIGSWISSLFQGSGGQNE